MYRKNGLGKNSVARVYTHRVAEQHKANRKEWAEDMLGRISSGAIHHDGVVSSGETAIRFSETKHCHRSERIWTDASTRKNRLAPGCDHAGKVLLIKRRYVCFCGIQKMSKVAPTFT